MARGKEIWVCPQCGTHVEISELGLYAEVRCPLCRHMDRVHVQLGNFRLESVLGVGGMSVVYRALDVTLRRPVALKVLNDTFRNQPERVERFENESAMMARVRHANVTSVYSAGRAYGRFYIAMELVEGKNLEHMVSREIPLGAVFALEIAEQVALGLRAASVAGLLHRDMKPGNILITPRNQVKVIDFGLALDETAGDTEEMIWATPYYVPPETLQRKPEDVRTDIYALGMTLRYMLTGVENFAGDVGSVKALLDCKRRLPSFAEERPDLDPMLCDLVDHMTQYSVENRPRNYDDLLDEMKEVHQALATENTGGKTSLLVGRLGWVVWLVVAGALGVGLTRLVADYLQTESEEVHHGYLEVQTMDTTPPEISCLQDALGKIDGEEFEQAVDELLVMSREQRDPCLAAWAAYLARTLTEIVPMVDGQAKGEEAQKQLRQLITGGKECALTTETFWECLRNNTQRMDPQSTNWYSAKGGWSGQQLQRVTPAAVQDIMRGNLPAPMVLVKLLELAEMALWQGKEDIVEECRKGLEDVQNNLGMYAGLGKLYQRIFEERLKVRRNARYQGVRTRLLERLRKTAPTQEDVASFEKMSRERGVSFHQRLLAEVEGEAARIGVQQAQMLLRKAPKSVNQGMSLAKMAEKMRQVVGDRPIIEASSKDAGNITKNVMDGTGKTVPPEIVSDIATVASVLGGPAKDSKEKLAASAKRRGIAGDSFRTIARSWQNRLEKTANVYANDEGDPLSGDRDAALAGILERCRRSFRVKLAPGKSLSFLNSPSVWSDQREMIMDEQQALFLIRAGVVLPMGGKQVPVLVLKKAEVGGIPLLIGEIAPVPEEKVEYVERTKVGVALRNVGDLPDYADQMKQNPTPACLRLEPRYD